VSAARASLALACALALAACSSTRIEGTWTPPDSVGKRISGPVFVIGALGDETGRRLYEDEIARRLRARSIRVVKSYDALPSPLGAEAAGALVETAGAVGATYLLSSAVIDFGKKTVVHSAPLADFGVGTYRHTGRRHRPGAYGGWYSRSWISANTTVGQVDIYTVETVLVDVATDRIDWTIRTKSAASTTLSNDVADLAAAIVDALADANRLADAD
jgi:hypothetical protein